MTHHLSTTTRRAAVVATACGLLTLGALPATAIPDPGPAPARHHHSGCALERVGSHLVRCDDLTGGGAQAPWWIPER